MRAWMFYFAGAAVIGVLVLVALGTANMFVISLTGDNPNRGHCSVIAEGPHEIEAGGIGEYSINVRVEVTGQGPYNPAGANTWVVVQSDADIWPIERAKNIHLDSNGEAKLEFKLNSQPTGMGSRSFKIIAMPDGFTAGETTFSTVVYH